MNYAKIINFDSGNARGLSVVLFVQGCEHKCPYCHNKETWDFNKGKLFDKKVQKYLIDSIKSPHIKNFVITGGDPLHPKNTESIKDFLVQNDFLWHNKKVIIYTGYTMEKLMERIQKEDELKIVISVADIIIDGLFDQTKITKQLDYRGSTNQRAWENVSKSLILYKDISDTYFKIQHRNGGI